MPRTPSSFHTGDFVRNVASRHASVRPSTRTYWWCDKLGASHGVYGTIAWAKACSLFDIRNSIHTIVVMQAYEAKENTKSFFNQAGDEAQRQVCVSVVELLSCAVCC